jgi:hypothetical protein
MDHDKSLSIAEFCLVEGIGRSSFYYLAAMGRAPEMVKAGKINRITPQARRDWQARREPSRTRSSGEDLCPQDGGRLRHDHHNAKPRHW